MDNPKISVIVPVYNAEKYLRRCIDSILAQTFTDFELLLVDDGSNDTSGVICDEYRQKDFRVKVFHKKNGGVSSARNKGLDESRGTLIVFVDSDDWIAGTHLSDLIKFSRNDIVIGGKTLSGSAVGVDSFNENTLVSKGNMGKVLSNVLSDNKLRVPWGKLYKRNIIETYKLRFNQKMRIAEDTIFVQQYLSHCESACFIKSASYFYYIQRVAPKYKLNEDELSYSMEIAASTYKTLEDKFSFDGNGYMNFIQSYFVGLYLDYVSSRPFSSNGYKKMKNTLIKANASSLDYYPHSLRKKIVYGAIKHKLYFTAYLYLGIASVVNKFRY